jgi:membrane-associated phospholipid phosphatase
MLSLIALLASAPAHDPFPRHPVYQISPKTDAVLIAMGTVGTVLPYLFASHLIHPRCPCDPGEVHGIDHSVIGNHSQTAATLSDLMAMAAVSAPVLIDALDVGVGSDFLADMVVYAEALSVNSAFVTLAKYTVQRPLPVVYAGQDSELVHSPGGYRSFYSGHTSTVMAALTTASTTWNARHHSGAWPWAIAGGTGLVVAGERVAAGRHFYTDVATGFLVGSAVGVLVSQAHLRQGVALVAAPTPGGAELFASVSS